MVEEGAVFCRVKTDLDDLCSTLVEVVLFFVTDTLHFMNACVYICREEREEGKRERKGRRRSKGKKRGKMEGGRKDGGKKRGKMEGGRRDGGKKRGKMEGERRDGGKRGRGKGREGQRIERRRHGRREAEGKLVAPLST